MEDARIGLVLENRYRIAERLAAGGMGVVYRAERIGLGKAVAVKFLHRTSALLPENRTRFEREAAAMSRLTHPNLVSIIDFGSHEGLPYLVMEYHPGRSLHEVVKEGALSPVRAVFIARQLLAGLSSAHASGVVHRDLKPGNVLLVGAPGEDLVKILDFGVAKLLDGGGGPTEVSVMSGHVLGTPSYMSPEHARAQSIDGRSDVYSVGIMLYEMVTGSRPFVAEGKLGILRKQVEEVPISPRERADISAALEAAILRAMEKERERRFDSAADFAAALAEVPEGQAGRKPEASAAAAADVPTEERPNHMDEVVRREAIPEDRVAQETDSRQVAHASATTRGLKRRRKKKRRTRVLRAVVVALFLGGLVGAGLLGAIQLGLIEVPAEWLNDPPWSNWQLPGDWSS